MKKIILFTNMSSIRKHWRDALVELYQPIPIDSFNTLINYLNKDKSPITVLLDEMSVSDIQQALLQLKEYNFVTTLVFNAAPEPYHASTLLSIGIKGYENSYLDKNNLRKMLESIENGRSWLFPDLTYFIINKFIKTNENTKPDFFSSLTEKEKDIALMIADGLSNKEIAQKEKSALSTIKGHIHHIFEKAGVNDRVALALKFK